MKATLRIAISAALAAAVVVAMAVPAFASGGFLPRVAGEVGFAQDGVRVSAEFEARATGAPAAGEEHSPAIGKFGLKTKGGLRYTARIEHIHAHTATEVHFGGMIEKSSDPTMVGKFVHVMVVDGGTPGREGDAISVIVTETMDHVSGTLIPVEKGNLVVRTN
jgi:hypothetical protein